MQLFTIMLMHPYLELAFLLISFIMETKYGFTKLSLSELNVFLNTLKVGRTILKVQHHHTYSPSYIHFKGNNHFEIQKGMKNYHVVHNGWSDIGQHFTIFPDGTILTGRNIEKSPACIYGQNANSICIENLGNFDIGGDQMSPEQKHSIVEVTKLLCVKFNLPINKDRIVYHHWFDLVSGVRNDGTKNNKSCPGTNFFGGNKVSDAENNFYPFLKSIVNDKDIKKDESSVLKYVIISSPTLNVRVASNSKSEKAKDRNPLNFGSVLRVYKEENNWLKISNSSEHWVSKRYTDEVKKATITATTLNVRSGDGTNYPKVGSLTKGQEIFVSLIQGDWCKVSSDNKWVSKKYLKFSNE